MKLLDEVNLKALFKEVVQATYGNCKVSIPQLCMVYLLPNSKHYCGEILFFSFQVLLQSGLIKSRSEERSLLKNLGSWLGKITIGRDHVLLAREIDPKSLIIEVILQWL